MLPEWVIGRRGSGPGEFRRVGGLAVCGDELFASDVKNHRIQCFDASTGDFKRAFGSKGDRVGEFRRPSAIAAVPTRSRLVVAELTGRRLQVLSLHGEPLQLIARHSPWEEVRIWEEGLHAFGCLCVDEERGKLYAAQCVRNAPLVVFDM